MNQNIDKSQFYSTQNDSFSCHLCASSFPSLEEIDHHLSYHHRIGVPEFNFIESQRKDHTSCKDLCDFLETSMLLKRTPRTGWVHSGVIAAESVADHSYFAALIALVAAPENLDRFKIMAILIIHDLAEALVSDITPFQGYSEQEKHDLEEKAFNSLIENLDEKTKKMLKNLMEEYSKKSSFEGKFASEIDKFEMILTANFYEKEQNLNLEKFYFSAEKKIFSENLRNLLSIIRSRHL